MRLSKIHGRVNVVLEMRADELTPNQAFHMMVSLLTGMGIPPQVVGDVAQKFEQLRNEFARNPSKGAQLTGEIPKRKLSRHSSGIDFMDLFTQTIFRVPPRSPAWASALQKAYGLRKIIERDWPNVHIQWDRGYPNAFADAIDQSNIWGQLANLGGESRGAQRSYLTKYGPELRTLLKKNGLEPIGLRGGVSGTLMAMLELAQLMWVVYKKIRDGEPITDLQEFFKWKLTKDDVEHIQQEAYQMEVEEQQEERADALAATEPQEPTPGPKPVPEPTPEPVTAKQQILKAGESSEPGKVAVQSEPEEPKPEPEPGESEAEKAEKAKKGLELARSLSQSIQRKPKPPAS